jgi:tyrosyl-tRNA synthetase
MLKADIELGGTDQKFNLLMGRELQKHFNCEPQVIMMTPLIEGLDGVKKMSKSLNNYIGINEPAEAMFGKIMSISDELMWRYLDVLSFKSVRELDHIKKAVTEGLNPRDVKMELAKELIARFHDNQQAEAAQRAFIERFRQGIIPEDLVEQVISADAISICNIIKQIGLTKSTSEAIRLIDQGAVKLDGERVSDAAIKLSSGSIHIIQIGKRRIAKVRLT